MDTISLGECEVHILGVIKGLKSEAEKVRKAFEEVRPEKVLISLSKEELEGLRNIPEDFVPELSRYEEIYAEGLGRFGEVAAPPPCYVAALELSEHFGVPLLPIDMDEQAYTELYCAAVGGGTLFRHSTRTWLMKRRKFSLESPEAFVLAWDRAVNNLDGFRMIEEKRAERMAKDIRKAAAESKKLLAVIELERARDVVELLNQKSE
ncbi:MAG: hypothetical protein A3K60_05205 [Euryarchaeota archaeon RBG_19FT_COMBO_56_21]|nr:MAG: hypothetical protein A3K60_05205 [Euryarchaeota archaeon RBG_19FT_COMBO_56_21]